MNELFKRLGEVDFRQVWPSLVDTVRDPSVNLPAFLLIIALAVVVTLILIAGVVFAFLSAPADEDELEGEAEGIAGGSEAAEEAATEAEAEPERRLARGLTTALWALAFLAVWVAGGLVTRQDVMCLTCHQERLVHAQRVQNADADPHGKTLCVDCHETPNIISSVTVAVVGRAVHYGGAVLRPSLARDYGLPVANSRCAACHKPALAGTVTDARLGVRMSHKEPLASKALCIDCHALSPETGSIGQGTVGMAPCLKCHDGKQVPVGCEYCHTKDIGFAVGPRQAVEPRDHQLALDCGGCHDQRPCDRCHGIRMPHSTAFKYGGHARVAVEDLWYNQGRMCKKCHSDTHRPCMKCHRGRMPSHGVPTWRVDHAYADPVNNGCDNCHGYNAWIVGRNFCQNCHPNIKRGLR